MPSSSDGVRHQVIASGLVGRSFFFAPAEIVGLLRFPATADSRIQLT